jgi:tetratricopeptide (TPR) repeat protein
MPPVPATPEPVAPAPVITSVALPVDALPGPEPEPPRGGTDPRIINRGRVNQKVLDALKQVKRRDASSSPDVAPSTPVVNESASFIADRMASNSLQVAIRMEQGGRLDEAIRFLEQSIGKSPDAPSLYNRLAIILMRERADLRRAEQLLQKAVDLAPENSAYAQNLQMVLSKRALAKR